MEIIKSNWATVYITNNIYTIYLYENKPYYCNGYLYENLTLKIENNILDFDGLCYLTNTIHPKIFGDESLWLEDLKYKPIPDEYVIKENFKNLLDKIKGKKSKFIPIFTEYCYKKEFRKFKSTMFHIHYETKNNETLSFKQFTETL